MSTEDARGDLACCSHVLRVGLGANARRNADEQMQLGAEFSAESAGFDC